VGAIEDGDRERLKWAGVFFRRQTPGQFMMRVRMPNGLTNAAQIRTIAAISQEFEPGFADITTRQQIQLRGFGIEHVPDIWRRLDAVGLVSIQTGMDNIRNIAGCPLAGLTPHELLDASPVVREFTDMFYATRHSRTCRASSTSRSPATEHCAR
jgi:ferredoxin-nitrite reductase